MTDLAGVLEDPDVEVVESFATFDPEARERWVETVEREENRAVAAAVRDGDGRVLLRRRVDEDGRTGWRLPGSPVGSVVDFEARLRTELEQRLDATVTGVRPFRVHKHTARETDPPAAYFYVLCRVEFERSPAAVVAEAPEHDRLEYDWFSERPADVVNPGVMETLFGE